MTRATDAVETETEHEHNHPIPAEFVNAGTDPSPWRDDGEIVPVETVHAALNDIESKTDPQNVVNTIDSHSALNNEIIDTDRDVAVVKSLALLQKIDTEMIDHPPHGGSVSFDDKVMSLRAAVKQAHNEYAEELGVDTDSDAVLVVDDDVVDLDACHDTGREQPAPNRTKKTECDECGTTLYTPRPEIKPERPKQVREDLIDRYYGGKTRSERYYS